MTNKNLKQHAIKGASLAVAGRLVRALQGIVALAILSRYLTPAEFGLMAMVAFVASLAQIFTDFGTRVALVQRREVTPLEENSVFWWNLGLGAALTGAIMALSPWIAGLMGDGAMQKPLLWVAPIFLIGALQGVPLSILERRMAFGRIALSEAGGAVAGSVAAVIMVLLGFKLEALIAQTVVAAIVTALVVITGARWRPQAQFNMAALKPLLSYGGYVTAAGVVYTLSAQADRPIVGSRLSPSELGYSTITEQIVLSPLRITVQMVRKVMFPVMASIQDDDARLRRGYIGMQYALMVVMAPIAFGLWAIAGPTVDLLLGQGWEMVTVLMGYMTIRSLFSTFNDLNSVVFSAKGWAKFQFKWSVFSGILGVGTLLLTVNYGIEAVVAGKLALAILLTPVNSYFALRLISQPAGEVVKVLIRPLMSAFAMALAVAWVQQQLALGATGLGSVGPLLQLFICIPLGGVLYLAAEMLIDRGRFVPLVRQILSRGQRG